MEYLIMTLEEAKKVARKDAIVLVAKQDLEQEDCNIGFTKKKFCECSKMLENAETIAKVCDEFANQLRVFSERQINPLDYKPKGTLSTILFRPK